MRKTVIGLMLLIVLIPNLPVLADRVGTTSGQDCEVIGEGDPGAVAIMNAQNQCYGFNGQPSECKIDSTWTSWTFWICAQASCTCRVPDRGPGTIDQVSLALDRTYKRILKDAYVSTRIPREGRGF